MLSKSSANLMRAGANMDIRDIKRVSFPFSSQIDKVYFEIEQGPIGNYPPRNLAKYDSNFNQSILKNPKDYYMAISKFSIPSLAIPFWVPDMISGFTQDNQQTIYNVTIGYHTGGEWQYFASPVMYVPENGMPYTSDLTNPYWYVQDINWALQLINNAIEKGLAHFEFDDGAYAFLQYDPDTSLISLILPPDVSGESSTNFYVWADYNEQQTTDGYVQIFFNYPLSILLSNINGFSPPNLPGENIIIGSDTTYQRDFQVWVWNQSGLSNNFNETTNTFTLTQQYYSLQSWFPLASIRVQTGSLPITNESLLPQSSNNGLSAQPIMQTFYPIYSTSDPKPALIIFTSQQYHLINMVGDLDIAKLNLQYFWISQNGTEFPLIIPYNFVMLTELTFVKKSTFTS